MVRKTHRGTPTAPNHPSTAMRRGRPSRDRWTSVRAAYEDGVDLNTLAARSGLRHDTITRRAKQESWADPGVLVVRLARGLEASMALAENGLSCGQMADAEKAVKVFDALIRATERLRGLRTLVACLAAPHGLDAPEKCGPEKHENREAGEPRDTADTHTAPGDADAPFQTLFARRAALERRLAQLAATKHPSRPD